MENLKTWRKAHGLTLQGMAEELRISISTIVRWEKGQVPNRAYGEILRQYMEGKEKAKGK